MTHSIHSLLREVGLPIPPGLANSLVRSVSCDSRDVQVGGLFLGLPGQKVDGGVFWKEALAAGAVGALISSSAARSNKPSNDDPVVVSPDPLEQWAGELASAFWGNPSKCFPLIGVTGTNGKTTVSYLIEHLSSAVGMQPALFGTLVNRWPGHSETAKNTTAFADVLQANLAHALDDGAQLGVMEVSSHSLAQHRVAGTNFSGAVFTNLTQDHLDYHFSMDSYFLAKSRLFNPPLLQAGNNRAVVNIDNIWGERLARSLGDRCWRSSLNDHKKYERDVELTIKDIEVKDHRYVSGILISPLGEGSFQSPLLGSFNLMNLLQSVGILLQLGFPLDLLLKAISSFPGVPGRMEMIRTDINFTEKKPTVLVDYAHTPDGLKNALLAIKPLVKGDLVCVFGCGGDRDQLKRPLMGSIAAEFADKIVLTSDNPRTEDPNEILQDVLRGIPDSKDTVIQEDREMAICTAISNASPNDFILIAGKGHEDYQIIGTQRNQFDDRIVARIALESRFSRS